MSHHDAARVAEFFSGRPGALPVFERAARQIRARFPGTTLRVQKTQIAFDDPYGFAFIWLPPKRGTCATLSFVLAYPLETPRVPHVTFIRHDRYTHHLPLDETHGVDDEVLRWLEEAHDLMRAMRHVKRL